VAAADPAYPVVALDPVHVEKPYTERLEAVCTVMKSTLPTRVTPPARPLAPLSRCWKVPDVIW